MLTILNENLSVISHARRGADDASPTERRGGDSVDDISGTSSNDDLYGGRGRDSINGSSGDDSIFGGQSQTDTLDDSDSLSGGLGDDSIYGNAGDDSIIGGLGNDRFYYAGGYDSDTISSFDNVGSAAGDIIVFSSSLFASATDALLAVQYTTIGGVSAAVWNINVADQLTVLGVASGAFTVDDFLIA